MCFKYSSYQYLMFDNHAKIHMHPGDSEKPQRYGQLLSEYEVPAGTSLAG